MNSIFVSKVEKSRQYLQEVEANKPTAGIQDRWFYATDTHGLYYDDGTNWNLINTLITEILVDTTCQTVAITGLDFNKYKRIEIQGSVINPSANNANISLCCNGDNTATNYYREHMSANGSNTGGVNANDGMICQTRAGKASFFITTVGYDYNNIFRALSQNSLDTGTSLLNFVFVTAGSSSVTNITRLDLISNQADSIGAGSKFIVKQG